jgi:hypothetical protein
MEASSRERDGGGDRRLCCRTQRPVGPFEGELRQRQRATDSQDGPRGALIKAVIADFGTAEGRSTARDGLKEKFTDSKPAEIKAKCIEALRQAGAVVDAKAPGDATAFKGWLRQISQHVAEASNEGGFLGIGGVPVSEAEKATLTEISSALKLAA